jgi:hypothetical protein
MKRLTLSIALVALVQSGVGCSKPVAPVETAPLVLPGDVGPILVLVDRLPGKEAFAEERARQVSIGLRHFSARTAWAYVDAASLEDVASAQVVVYLGINGNDPLSSEVLARLRKARRLIVTQSHLARLRDAHIAFEHTSGGRDIIFPPGTAVRYKGEIFRSNLPDFRDFDVREPARVLAEYSVTLANRSSLPYIVQDGAALFVNGEFSFDSDDAPRRGATLVACDAIAEFLGARPLPSRPQAMLRLEDVSALTPPARLKNVVEYLAAAHVPYGISVIPDLHIRGETVPPLREQAELVEVLRWAEDHGATVILHGLHHCCSSEDAEGYEFWDQDHNAPISNDSAEWMRAQVSTGTACLTALGLHPRMWETPHYSASPADYRVVSEFFSSAWELRDPVNWLPWPLRRDEYGAMLLPENLGYVSLDGRMTVADQLARARELLVCRSCLAAGYLHPSTVWIEDVQAYVDGLRGLGYVFVDPAQAVMRLPSGSDRDQ